MLKYSQRALRGIVHLFSPYNDIDIFIEDTRNRNMYEIIVNRILDGQAKVKRVFSLNGRNEVIAACENDQKDRMRKRLYIVDRDFGMFYGSDAPNIKYLYELSVYTSENLVISELAAVEIGYESMPDVDKKDVETAISIQDLIRESCAKLSPLFAVYAAKHYLEKRDSRKIHIGTSGHKVVHLAENDADGISVCSKKVAKRIREIVSELQKEYGYQKKDIDNVIETMRLALPVSQNELKKFISGKTYLLPLIHLRLSKKVSCRSTLEQLKARLARFAEIDIDPDLPNAVIAASKGS